MKSLIRIAEVARRTSWSRRQIYKQMKLGKFPRPVRIGTRAVAWVEQEIDEHVKTQIRIGRP